jgi:dTDP-4-amino-4,6-dideoxygalactose transaminase
MIRFQRPSFPSSAAIEGYLCLARKERWFSNWGPCCRLLRERLRDAVGCDAIPVANATLGLIAAISALRHRAPTHASEALVPSFAFAASAQAAVWNGLEPVFVDIDVDHWHIDPVQLDDALARRRGRVAIVIALSSFGTPPPPAVRSHWEDSCAEAGVPLVVDSAAGFGAQAADGTPIGLQGDAEVVSFHAVKPLSIGEGGAVFARDPEVLADVQRVTEFGFDERRQVTVRKALNGKLSEPAAAIALAALDDFDRHLQTRRKAAAELIQRLPADFETQREHALGTWQFVPVKAPTTARRDRVMAASRGSAELRTYYNPLHTMSAFRTAARAGELAVTTDLGARILSLPMADDLTIDEIDVIAEIIRRSRTLDTCPVIMHHDSL